MSNVKLPPFEILDSSTQPLFDKELTFGPTKSEELKALGQELTELEEEGKPPIVGLRGISETHVMIAREAGLSGPILYPVYEMFRADGSVTHASMRSGHDRRVREKILTIEEARAWFKENCIDDYVLTSMLGGARAANWKRIPEVEATIERLRKAAQEGDKKSDVDP